MCQYYFVYSRQTAGLVETPLVVWTCPNKSLLLYFLMCVMSSLNCSWQRNANMKFVNVSAIFARDRNLCCRWFRKWSEAYVCGCIYVYWMKNLKIHYSKRHENYCGSFSVVFVLYLGWFSKTEFIKSRVWGTLFLCDVQFRNFRSFTADTPLITCELKVFLM